VGVRVPSSALECPPEIKSSGGFFFIKIMRNGLERV